MGLFAAVLARPRQRASLVLCRVERGLKCLYRPALGNLEACHHATCRSVVSAAAAMTRLARLAAARLP